jgi:hypothetical protein
LTPLVFLGECSHISIVICLMLSLRLILIKLSILIESCSITMYNYIEYNIFEMGDFYEKCQTRSFLSIDA